MGWEKNPKIKCSISSSLCSSELFFLLDSDNYEILPSNHNYMELILEQW